MGTYVVRRYGHSREGHLDGRNSVCTWGLVGENWRELGLLVDERVLLELGRDMWTLESHLGVQDACVLSEAPVSPLLIDPRKELTSWWTSQMNGA